MGYPRRMFSISPSAGLKMMFSMGALDGLIPPYLTNRKRTYCIVCFVAFNLTMKVYKKYTKIEFPLDFLSCYLYNSICVKKYYISLRPLGQVVKTSPFHGGITGSNPVGVIYGGIAKWPNAADCKSVPSGSKVQILLPPSYWAMAKR